MKLFGSFCKVSLGRTGRDRCAPPHAPSGIRAGAASLVAMLGLGAGASLAPLPARATLGEDVKTVELDRQQINATRQVTTHAAFAVHDLQLANGGLVHEYVSPAGAVFGVSWGGPFMPNLRQLLGVNFDAYTGSARQQRGGRGHLAVHEGALVVESNGRMRSFHGRAYLSNAIPAGVSIDDIK